jgi:glycosyltransferase involved in cell wall biosynthesis
MEEIVHITEAFGGGVLSMLLELSNRAAEAGIKVTVMYSLRRETPRNFADLFHPHVKLMYVQMCREINLKRDWISLWALVGHLRDRDPSVVHLHSSKAGVLGRAAARIAAPNARILYSPHGLAFLRRDVSVIRKFAYLSFERIADCIGGTVVACSSSELHEINGKIRARSATLIENAVNVSEVPSRQARGDGKVRIGMSGRASYQKNHEAFLKLANDLQGPGVGFLWIGGHREEVPDAFANDALACSGWVDRTHALTLMSELDIYVQTSRWEGMPLALIEAQVAGIPAVVTDVVGNRDVVCHGVTGFVASSTEELAHYLTILRDDPQLREQMGAAARHMARSRFSMDLIFRQWLAAYDLSAEKQLNETADAKLVVR